MGKAVKRNKYWTCPFFKWDGEQEVSCEGGRIRFPTRKCANNYMNAFCANGDWEHCTVAAALMKHYETEDK